MASNNINSHAFNFLLKQKLATAVKTKIREVFEKTNNNNNKEHQISTKIDRIDITSLIPTPLPEEVVEKIDICSKNAVETHFNLMQALNSDADANSVAKILEVMFNEKFILDQVDNIAIWYINQNTDNVDDSDEDDVMVNASSVCC